MPSAFARLSNPVRITIIVVAVCLLASGSWWAFSWYRASSAQKEAQQAVTAATNAATTTPNTATPATTAAATTGATTDATASTTTTTVPTTAATTSTATATAPGAPATGKGKNTVTPKANTKPANPKAPAAAK